MDSIRKSGIDVVGEVPWGTHLCQFYKTKDDLLNLLVPYFKAGLEDNEFCMWVTSEPLAVEDAEKALRRSVPDLDERLENEQMLIVPYTDLYMRDGYFDMQRVLNDWTAKLETALDKGFEGMRDTGNIAWLEVEDWDSFTEYEEKLNDIIGDYNMMAICTYSLDRCGVSEVIDVVANHQHTLIKREGEWSLIESSERRKARRALQEAEKSLQELSYELIVANRELESYARNMSHDLRSPLAAASIATDLLKEAAREDDVEGLRAEVEDATSVVQRNINKCHGLINELLTLAEAGNKPIQVSDIDVTSLIREIVAVQKDTFRDKRFRVITDEDLGTLRANETQVYQLFSNLVVNALLHNDRDNPVIEVHKVDASGADRHRFVVRDNGPGIPEDRLEDVFRAFSKWGTGSDAGIGLSIVKRIVEAYDGTITVHNDNGACFEFEMSDAS
ncbi:MAG TPA: MEDS domain-containing protein [Candidatus Anoxymicrobiaceae bacterium]